MEKEFLVTKISDQKVSKDYKEYEFIRMLNIEDNEITLDSFNQFIELEREDKNMAFFVTDKIKFLSYSNPRKFYKSFLKTYKESIDENPLVYTYIRDKKLKEDIDTVLEDSENFIDLNKSEEKTK